MSDDRRAVFLSYASQDAEAARLICEALRSSGVEVWFDQRELRGGDTWDQKIRRQIHECALFLPVISANTRARPEGYFRREWKLAVERTHDMAEDVAFLVPVVIDDTTDTQARVPDRFREVHWMRLPGGETPPEFCARVQNLLTNESVAGAGLLRQGSGDQAGSGPVLARPAAARRSPLWRWRVRAAVGVVAFLTLAVWRPWRQSAPPELKAPVTLPDALVATSEAQRYVEQVRTFLKEYENGNLSRDNLELADQLGQKALQLEPANAEAWALVSQVSQGLYAQNYDQTQARRDAIDSQAARAVKLAPELPEAQFAYADALRLEAATLPEAERIFRQLMDRFPKEQRYVNRLAGVLNVEGKREESLSMRERAIRLAGDDPIALLIRSEALAARGCNNEAEQALDLFLARRPNEAGYLRKFQMMLDRGDVDAMRRVLVGMPPTLLHNDNIANWAAAIWLGSRDTKQARAALRAAPGDYFSVLYWEGPKDYFEALSYAMDGSREAARAKWEDALQVIDKHLAREPNRPTLLFLKADVLGRLDRKPEAEQVARVFRQLAGSNKPTWLDLHLSVAMGRRDEAISYLETWDQAGQLSTAQRTSLCFDPRFDSLRGNPRFEALLAEPTTNTEQKEEGGAPKTPASEAKK